MPVSAHQNRLSGRLTVYFQGSSPYGKLAPGNTWPFQTVHQSHLLNCLFCLMVSRSTRTGCLNSKHKTDLPPLTVPISGSTYFKTSLPDCTASPLLIPSSTLRGGLKFSMGNSAHTKRTKSGTARTRRRRGKDVKRGPAILR